ncbi:MAG TPA: S8 family serine peptidase [Acetobacteraceae bacterium]|nr:S8 family serine peptidase [Acetobacteraceae bacterium]
MVAIRVLMLVEDTPPVVASAASVAAAVTAPAQPPPASTPQTISVPNVPREISLDADFIPVPVRHESAAQTLAMAGMFAAAIPPQTLGPNSYVVRGTVDSAHLDTVTRGTMGPGGEPRLFADPGIGAAPTCGGDPPVGTATDVERLLQAGRLRRLGMQGEGVALAIVDTGINLEHLRSRGLAPRMNYHASWTPQTTVQPGAAPLDHGTMCAFDALLSAPRAVLLDHAVLRSTRRGGSVMDGILSDAVQSYGVLLRLMLLPDDERFFHSLVVSNSWGMFHPSWDFPPGHPGRYFDNPQHPFNRIVGSLANAGADIVFAAGNCGPACPDGRCAPIPPDPQDRRISGANGHPDVLCVAGVDTQRNLVGYSSHGPGALANDKPDLATYTHFLGSEAFGTGTPDSGTSAACPVAAGVVAALRSAFPYAAGNANRAPGHLRGFLCQTADKAGGAAAWNPQFGHGILFCAQFDNAGQVLR